jgi:hypothetical protein
MIENVAPINQVLVQQLIPTDKVYPIVTMAPDGFTTWAWLPRSSDAMLTKALGGDPPGIKASALSQGIRGTVIPGPVSVSYFAYGRSDGWIELFFIDALGNATFAGRIKLDTPVQSLLWADPGTLDAVTATSIRQLNLTVVDAKTIKIAAKTLDNPPKLQNPLSSALAMGKVYVGQADGSIRTFDATTLEESKPPLRPPNKK